MSNNINEFQNGDEYRKFLKEKAETLFKERTKMSKREFLSLFSEEYSQLNKTGKKRFETISNLDGDNTTVSKKEMMAFYSLMDLDISGKTPDGKVDVKNSILNTGNDKVFESVKDSVLSETSQPQTTSPKKIDSDSFTFKSPEVSLPDNMPERFNPEDYTPEKIKERFPEPEFKVSVSKLMPGVPPMINVDEKGGKRVCAVVIDGDDVKIVRHFYDEQGNKTRMVTTNNGEIIYDEVTKYSYDENGNVTFRQRIENGKAFNPEYIQYDENNNPIFRMTTTPDGKILTREEYGYDSYPIYFVLDENGNEKEIHEGQIFESQEQIDMLGYRRGVDAYLSSDIVREEIHSNKTSSVIYDENNNIISEEREPIYDTETGELIQEGIEEHSPLADDLYKAITAKNRLGLPTTDLKLLKESVDKLSPSNFAIISARYESQYGKKLIEDLENEWGARITNNKEMKELLDKVRTLMVSSGGKSDYNYLLEQQLEGIPSEELLDKLIYNSERWIYKFLEGDKSGKSLMQSIMDKNLTLPLEKRKEYLTYMIERIIGWKEGEPDYAGMKEYKEKVYEELNKQLNKVGSMDSTKLEQLLAAKPRNIKYKDQNVLNGKIDMDYSQGYLGTCWLISAINALNLSEGGQKYLDSVLKPNSDGNVEIKFPDAEKSYVITKRDVELGGFLNSANGDADVKALEKAAGKYLTDLGFKGDPLQDGNRVSAGLAILVGGDRIKVYNAEEMTPDWINREFSKSNNAIVLARKNLEHKINEAFNAEGEKVELPSTHGYTFSRIDENFVYFINPHNPKVELHLPKEEFAKAFDNCAIATL